MRLANLPLESRGATLGSVTAGALLLLLAVVSPLEAGEARCPKPRAEGEPDPDPAWTAVETAAKAERDSGALPRRGDRSFLPELRTSIYFYGPDGSEGAVSHLRSLLPGIQQQLREVGAAASEQNQLDVVLLDAVEQYETEGGGTVPAWYAGRRDEGRFWFAIHRGGWEGKRARLGFYFAHEFFHHVQRVVTGVNNCKNEWWYEGTADWFAHRVFPGVDFRKDWIDAFNTLSNVTSLTALSYEAQVYFFWADRSVSPQHALGIGRSGDHVLKNPGRVAALLPPEKWNEFLEALVSGSITYPDGRIALKAPYLGEVMDAPGELHAPPLAFARGQYRIGPGAGDVEVSGNAKYATARPHDRWETHALGPAPLGVVTDCGEEKYILVGAVSTDGEPLDLEIGIPSELGCRCQKKPPADHCLVGIWRNVGSDLPETYNRSSAMLGQGSRWQGQDPGEIYLTFRADGSFEQLSRRKSESKFNHPTDVAPVKQTVYVEQNAIGRWSSPARGQLEICKDRIEGTLTNVMSAGGRQATRTTDLPHDPAAEAYGFEHTYVCEGDRATVTLLLSGSPFVTWEAQRVTRVPPPPVASGPN